MSPACNICGGTDFIPGPGGRTGPTGQNPRCTGCHSLERHRAIRAAMSAIPGCLLSWRRMLHFAPDPSLETAWFASYESSVYGGENSLDLQELTKPGDSYDYIALSHVLEFVPDHRKAVSELVRIGSECTIIHITFASQLREGDGRDFTEPRAPYGRFHIYGRDVADHLGLGAHGLRTVFVDVADPVTGVADVTVFLTRQRSDAESLRSAFRDAGFDAAFTL